MRQWCCAGLATAAALSAQEPAANGAPPPTPAPQDQAPAAANKEPAPPAFVRGTLTSRYWLRWTGNDRDQDLYETLSLDVGDERKDAVTGYFLGRLAADLDGTGAGQQQFFGVNDSVGGRVDARVYDAYADFHHVPGLQRLRLGRQLDHDTPELAYFDGASVTTQPAAAGELQVGAYGGASAHLFESSASGDLTAGLWTTARPWRGGRARLDWMHLEDEALLGAHNDDLLGAGLWQNWEQLQLEGHYTRVEDRDRDVRGRATWTDPDARFTGQLSWYQLLRTQRDLVLELDPFFNALHEQFPYWQSGALLGKGFGEHVDVQLGSDVRRVTDRADIGTYNRDYERVYATFGLLDVVAAGCTVSATGDWWQSNGQNTQTWGADVTQKSGATTLSAGSYWSLYKFDLFLDRERERVRTYYAKLRHVAAKDVTLELAYELEVSDLDEFHVLRMGVTWRF